MNAAEKALSTFREPPYMYICAQTICAAFGRDDLLDTMKACGGDKAPEGTCGALYGAMMVAPDKADALLEAFAADLCATTMTNSKPTFLPAAAELGGFNSLLTLFRL